MQHQYQRRKCPPALDPFDRPFPRRDRPRRDRHARPPPLQVIGQGLGRAVPPRRLFLQALQADRLQVAVQLGIDRPRPRRLLIQYLANDLAGRVASEWRLAGQRFVKRRAQAVDVGRCRHRLGAAAGLFRRHVGRRPHHRAGLGRRHPGIGPDPLGQSEVGHVRLVMLVEQDIRRFDIPMQDRPLMSVMEGAGDLGHQCSHCARVVLQARDVSGQVPTLNELHAEIGLIVLLADFVDRDDVRVV